MKTQLYSLMLSGMLLSAGSAVSATNCPEPGAVQISSISVDRPSVMGGVNSFRLTLNFSQAVPANCQVAYIMSAAPSRALGGYPTVMRENGNGTASRSFPISANGVDRDTVVTMTAQPMTGSVRSGTVVSTTIAISAPPLESLSLDQPNLRHRGTTGGRVKIGGGFGGFYGDVNVQLTANPMGLINIPVTVKVGEQVTPLGDGTHRVTEFVGTFQITPRVTVQRETPVTLTATHNGISYSQVLTLEPPSTEMLPESARPKTLPPVVPSKPITLPSGKSGN